MNMNAVSNPAARRAVHGGAVALVLLAVGCIPEKRIVWSPDGRRAAVISDSGLAFCDVKGELTPVLVSGVKQAEWLADSKRLVVTRRRELGTFAEVAALCTPERRGILKAAADSLHAEALVYDGPLDKFEPKSLETLTSSESAAVLLYVREQFASSLAGKFGKSWDDLKDAKANIWSVDVLDASRPTDLTSIGASTPFSQPTCPKPSPDGTHVAWVEEIPGNANAVGRLVVAAIGADASRVVAPISCMVTDWSADGRSIAFISVASGAPRNDAEGDKLRLGAVSLRTVRDQSGALLTEFPPAQELAGLVVHDYHPLRCLKDGRVLFSAAEMQLPCTARDMPRKVSVFAVEPGRSATVTRVLTREAEAQSPDGAALFVVSPDERRLLLPGADGQFAIFTLATGEIQVFAKEADGDTGMLVMPSWRTSDEVCTVVPKGHSWGGKERSEVVLWSLAGRQCISRTWSNDAAKGILVDADGKP